MPAALIGSTHPSVAVGGRIGPNAVIRLAEALRAGVGEERTREIFSAAGQLAHLRSLPSDMIDENVVTTLHAAVRRFLGDAQATQVNSEAGRLTARYLLANRIPGGVQLLLRILPAGVAARMLTSAIQRNAWTFVGSGTLRVTWAPSSFQRGVAARLCLSVHSCPICRSLASAGPACAYYAGTFQTLFSTLVNKEACVVETTCQARGDDRCSFEVSW